MTIEKAGTFNSDHNYTAWLCRVSSCTDCSGAFSPTDRRPTNTAVAAAGGNGGGSTGASAAGADGVGHGIGAAASNARAGNASDTGKANAHADSAVDRAAHAEDDDGSYGGTVSLDGTTISLGDINPAGNDDGSYGGTDSSVDTNPKGEDDAYQAR